MADFAIEGRPIGGDAPCYVIAEAGSNHDGDLDQARRLIDVAAEAGADAVKFQVFKAERLYPRSAGVSGYLGREEQIYDLVEALELPYEWLPELASHCEHRGITLLASVFDERSADELERFVPAFKIASYELTEIPLIEHVARKGKPMILSTGAGMLDEIDAAVAAVREAGNERFALLQCTASYPAPPEALHVRAMLVLRERYAVPVGFSDHSRDAVVGPVVAVALGASVIEKHFTISNDLPGPDHQFALEPDELREMIRCIRQAELSLGQPVKDVDPVELELRRFARRSVFAIRDIPAGEELTPENVAVLRTGWLEPGLEPAAYGDVIGRRARRRISAETAIREGDLE